jgi:hypothetical protein
MQHIGLYRTSRGNLFDLQYDEETKTCQAVGPIPPVGAAGVAITERANSSEHAKTVLERRLEEEGY